MKQHRVVGGLAAFATVIGGTAFFAASGPATAGSSTSLSFGKSSDAVVTQKGTDGKTHLVVPKGGVLPLPKNASAKPRAAAKTHLAREAGKFGIDADGLEISSVTSIGNGTVVKADQKIDGVSVLAGQLAVSLDGNGGLQSINGEVTRSTSLRFPTGSTFAKGELAAIAKQAAALQTGRKSTEGLRVKTVGRQWYDAQLVGAPGAKADNPRPVQEYEVYSTDGMTRYKVLVNVSTKRVELAYDMHQDALKRVVCDGEGQEVDAYECDGETLAHARTEGQGQTGIADVDNMYDYMHDTAVRFASYVNLDLTSQIGFDYQDGQGKALRGAVRVCITGEACPFQNAFWDGRQGTFGEGFVVDDVVAHEYAHGVTGTTSELAYIFQTGAINEGLSDAWGEVVDITNGSADDTAANRWLIAEGSSVGAFRDMADPPNFDHPDRMTSPDWFDGSTLVDNGGVHRNSGVFNKAFFLMTDGQDFNGYDVRGLGPAKAAKITWTLQNLLTSGADYKDVFYTLPLSCRKNIGRAGTFVTEADCKQVDKVVRATEMYKDPLVGSASNVTYCDGGEAVNASYYEGFESKDGSWTYGPNWFLSSEIASFGRYASVGKDAAVAWVFAGDDTSLTQNEPVTIEPNSFLRFDHSYIIDTGDGAAVDYSVDNGSTWQPLSDLPNVNGEDTPVDVLDGQNSYAGVGVGYGGSRYDLSTLAGQSVNFRFRSAVETDNSAWWVDNLKLYSCG